MTEIIDSASVGSTPPLSAAAFRRSSLRAGALAAALAVMASLASRADDTSAMSQGESSGNPVAEYFNHWFERVSKTQAEQPHWVTPLVTVTPRLEQEFRYDQSWQSLPGARITDNFGGTKGLELIPEEHIELIIGVPAYESENTSPHKNGWSDETFLLKYRILSANEEDGNYILTAFMGLSVPSGSAAYSSKHFAYTPTVAFGKGWGDFDFQSTVGISVPDDAGERVGPGTPILFNTAFQYHVCKLFWPEVEANYAYWPNGKHEGLNQLFITPGLVLGRFPISGRVGLTLAAGCQIAVTDKPLMHKNIIFSARLPF